jgi:deoxyribodipyrimidine photo-lyase
MGILKFLPQQRLIAHGISEHRFYVYRDCDKLSGKYVLYWLQASQRERYNYALESAVLIANSLNLPLVAGVVLIDNYPLANDRHYRFMVEGWSELSKSLNKRGVGFSVQVGDRVKGVMQMAENAAAVVTDSGYTRFQEEWRHDLSTALTCPLLQVESNVVVPVAFASPKEEYAARTIRPKINKHLKEFLVPLKRVSLKNKSGINIFNSKKLEPELLLKKLCLNSKSLPSVRLEGGESRALKLLNSFIKRGSRSYDEGRNCPEKNATSLLSPYLHFGQISPVDISLKILSKWGKESSDDFLEQLIIRRELAMNFVYYNDDYDSPKCLPDWAVKTLDEHSKDKREYVYSLKQLIACNTHDMAWNAAQKQLINTGHMAGYMRMYWGKKVLEWSQDWRQAYKNLIYINDTCELDGRDPNGYAGVAWIFGKHDRPWTRRKIFGTIRYMNANGLKRKFDIEKYISQNIL